MFAVDPCGLAERKQRSRLPSFMIGEMSDTQSDPLKLLFICSKNKWRSLTAEQLLDGFNGYAVRSVGTEKDARVKVTAGHIGWADLIFVMETKHQRRLQEKYADILANKRVVCLNITDDYGLMAPELIDLLKASLDPYIVVPD